MKCGSRKEGEMAEQRAEESELGRKYTRAAASIEMENTG